jgi:hypothetical protein
MRCYRLKLEVTHVPWALTYSAKKTIKYGSWELNLFNLIPKIHSLLPFDASLEQRQR